MATTQSCERVFLSYGDSSLVEALQMHFVEDLYCVLLLGRRIYNMIYLHHATEPRCKTPHFSRYKHGPEKSTCVTRIRRTVEYDPSPRISQNSKSSSDSLNPAELFLDFAVLALDLLLDYARLLRPSGVPSTSPNSFARCAGVERGVGGASDWHICEMKRG
jgi:hypothetical protein